MTNAFSSIFLFSRVTKLEKRKAKMIYNIEDSKSNSGRVFQETSSAVCPQKCSPSVLKMYFNFQKNTFYFKINNTRLTFVGSIKNMNLSLLSRNKYAKNKSNRKFMKIYGSIISNYKTIFLAQSVRKCEHEKWKL